MEDSSWPKRSPEFGSSSSTKNPRAAVSMDDTEPWYQPGHKGRTLTRQQTASSLILVFLASGTKKCLLFINYINNTLLMSCLGAVPVMGNAMSRVVPNLRLLMAPPLSPWTELMHSNLMTWASAYLAEPGWHRIPTIFHCILIIW